MVTNLHRIAKIVSKYGADSVNIHPIPMSQYWIVMYYSENSHPDFRAIICNPELTTYKLVEEYITLEQYVNLWQELTRIEFAPHLKDTSVELTI